MESIYVYTKSMRKGYTRCEGSSNPHIPIAHVYMDSNARYRSVPFSHHVRIPYAKREDAGRKNRGCKLPKKNYGTIRISWYPKYISVTSDRNLITSVPSAPMLFILAARAHMAITRDHTIDIIFTVSMLFIV